MKSLVTRWNFATKYIDTLWFFESGIYALSLTLESNTYVKTSPENETDTKNKGKERDQRKQMKKSSWRITYVFIFRHDGSYFEHPWNQFDHIDEFSSWAMNFTSKNHRNDLKYKTARVVTSVLFTFRKEKTWTTCLSNCRSHVSQKSLIRYRQRDVKFFDHLWKEVHKIIWYCVLRELHVSYQRSDGLNVHIFLLQKILSENLADSIIKNLCVIFFDSEH